MRWSQMEMLRVRLGMLAVLSAILLVEGRERAGDGASGWRRYYTVGHDDQP